MGGPGQAPPSYQRPQVPPTQIQQLPIPGQPPSGPIPASGGPMSKKGVKMATLVVVAVACLLIGVGITTAVILLTQR